MSGAALEMLRTYYKRYKPNEFLFEGKGDRSHLSERSIQEVFRHAAAAAGIKKNTLRFIVLDIVLQLIYWRVVLI